MTLTEFLLARIAEDEAITRTAVDWTTREWVAADSLLMAIPDDRDLVAVNIATAEHYHYDAAIAHAARHEPARVLADCEAKRRIVELHAPVGGYNPPDSWYGDQNRCESCAVEAGRPGIGLGVTMHRMSWPCPTLRLLALPYASHEDYREEWWPFTLPDATTHLG